MKYIKLVTVYIMSFAYTYVGIRHFIDPDFFLAIYLSGLAEIILGLLLLNKKKRTTAAVGIILLLILVFPANIHLVQSELSQSLLGVTREQAVIRLPFQALFILIAYWHSKND